MSAIVTAVLKGTLGFLVKKSRQSAAEKLKDGDVTDQQLRSWIVDEMDNVNLKLDAMAKKDLGASISFFKEGLVFLNKVLDMESSGGSKTAAASAVVEKTTKTLETNPHITKITTVGANVPSLTEEMKELSLNNLNESGKEALFDAKKRFDQARFKATEAFNNEVLPPSDRILAMGVRLMATILEKAENPVSAVAACKSGLEELHLMPFVRENFSVELKKGVKSKFNKDERRQILSAICQINRIIYDVTLMVGDKEGLFIWPCVQIGDEKVDPLRDSRVVSTLRKLEMGECSLAWSFGQEGKEEGQRLNSAMSIATNTLGQFLVVDSTDKCVKVFDTYGTFLYSFGPSTEDEDMEESRLVAVATDRDNNAYVLVQGEVKYMRGQLEYLRETARVHLFDRSAVSLHYFTVEEDFIAATIKLKDKSLLLVPGKYHPPRRRDCLPSNFISQPTDRYFVLCNTKGKRMGRSSKNTLRSNILDITAADDCIMVLDEESNVYVFPNISDTSDGKAARSLVSCYLPEFSVAEGAHAITFHSTSGHVIITSNTTVDRSQVLFYSKEGLFERSIELDLEKKYWITRATVTTNGRICITANSFSGGKVLVLQ